MRQIQLLFFSALTFIALLGSSSFAHAAVVKPVKTNSYLLILNAASADFTKQQGQYFLTIQRPSNNVLAFATSGKRKTLHIKTQALIAKWQDLFSQSRANASLVHAGIQVSKAGQQQAMAVELKQPVVLSNGDIRFGIKKLSGDNFSLGQFKSLSLFIDDIHLNRRYSFGA